MRIETIKNAIDAAFERCKMKKTGEKKKIIYTPIELVDMCMKHLRERSDPIISPHFLSQCDAEDIFEYDAVSHEMQRHRMTIGVFYQYLILELMRGRWPVFDGTREGDVVADIATPDFAPGLRVYMSVKKSGDTVGGQDFGGVVRRLENEAKQEKNLTRPYLCVMCIATPPKGLLRGYDDRKIKCTQTGSPYSLNCEIWGPGFVYPYLTGRDAIEVYLQAIKRVAGHLPFMTIKNREKCSRLLKAKLKGLGLLDASGKVQPKKFMLFINRRTK